MIDLRNGTITVSGPLFSADMPDILRKNVEDAIDDLAKEGERMIRSNLGGIHSPTGLTAGGVWGGALRGRAGVPFGAVYMKGGLSRSPGSAKYPPSRRPYIIATVLETGHYGGSRVSRAGGARGWAPRVARTALHQTKRAYLALGPKVREKFDNIVKGLT